VITNNYWKNGDAFVWAESKVVFVNICSGHHILCWV